MPSSMPRALPPMHPRMVAMRGEGVRKKVADPTTREALGRAIDFALEYAGYTRKSASADMGYADDTTLNRWINAAPNETPNMAKLLALPGFREGFMLALAGESDHAVTRTTIELPRRRTGTR